MMPDWWFYIGMVVFLVSTVVCIVAGLAKKPPNDVTILSVVAVELFLLVYLVASAVRMLGGEQISGPLWEFWGYMVTAVVIPIGGIYWCLLERSRWSNFVLSAVGLVILVMMFRMEQLWYGGATAL